MRMITKMSNPDEAITVCGVCSRLPLVWDFSEKHCVFCKSCGEWICDAHLQDWTARGIAMFVKKVSG
jgi:hypothetical protein